MVVLSGVGVGGPGMAMASRSSSRSTAPAWARVAVVTDGQLSGLVNKGLVVGEVSPEAAIGGPLGLVQDGDPITIDVGGARGQSRHLRHRDGRAPPALPTARPACRQQLGQYL